MPCSQEQYAQILMAVGHRDEVLPDRHLHRVVGMAAGRILVASAGAKKPTRVKLFTKLLLAEDHRGCRCTVLAELLPRLIVLFGTANESVFTDFALKSLRIYLCMIIRPVSTGAVLHLLQAMGRRRNPPPCPWCSGVRRGLALLPFGSSGWTACCPALCRISSPS